MVSTKFNPIERIKFSLQNDRDFTFFIFVAVASGIATGIYGTVFNNYLNTTYSISETQRGLLEFPREMPGALIMLVLALLAFIGDVRIAMLGMIGAALGALGLGFSAGNYSLMVGWNKPFAAAAAYVSSRFIPKLAKSMRVIPVYRKSIKGLNKTINISVEALCNNENLLIFPDIDYTSDSESMGEMYTGFISLDRFYFMVTGRHVDFIPVRTDMKTKQIILGKPSRIKEDEKYADAKKRISEELRYEFNSH